MGRKLKRYIMIKFAVHQTFDCMDYNEHYYFETFEDAHKKFAEIRKSIIDNDSITETYTDEFESFYVQEPNQSIKLYIQEI
jgi:hypothetical protein